MSGNKITIVYEDSSTTEFVKEECFPYGIDPADTNYEAEVPASTQQIDVFGGIAIKKEDENEPTLGFVVKNENEYSAITEEAGESDSKLGGHNFLIKVNQLQCDCGKHFLNEKDMIHHMQVNVMKSSTRCRHCKCDFSLSCAFTSHQCSALQGKVARKNVNSNQVTTQDELVEEFGFCSVANKSKLRDRKIVKRIHKLQCDCGEKFVNEMERVQHMQENVIKLMTSCRHCKCKFLLSCALSKHQCKYTQHQDKQNQEILSHISPVLPDVRKERNYEFPEETEEMPLEHRTVDDADDLNSNHDVCNNLFVEHDKSLTLKQQSSSNMSQNGLKSAEEKFLNVNSLQNEINVGKIRESIHFETHHSTQSSEMSFQCTVGKYKTNRKLFLKQLLECDLSPYKCERTCLPHLNVRSLSKRKTFKCRECNKEFSSYSSMRYHVMTHFDEKLLKCELCDYTSVHKRNLICHMRVHTGEKPFECTICHKSFSHPRYLRKHIKLHSDEKPFKCELCDFICITKEYLNIHMRRHTGEKPFECTTCNKIFSQKSHLNTHLKTHSDEKPFKCELCDYRCIRKGGLIRHMRIHTGEKPFECTICHKSFSDPGYLRTHIKFHSDEKPFKCELCDYRCIEKGGLIRHMRSHTSEKPFECTICHKTFSYPRYLRKHIKLHSDQKPFKCELCDFRCIHKEYLNIHMRRHTGEKPFECTTCNKIFSQKSHLNTHLKVHSDEKPFKCDLCDYRCVEKGNLNDHMKRHTCEKPFECSKCKKCFSCRSSFKRHVMTHSNDNPC